MDGLNNQKKSSYCTIKSFQGNSRFVSRINSMGLTIGTEIEVIQNSRSNPLLLFARDTMIAISKKEAKNIMVELSNI